MAQKPIVSVCMITYNHEKFIEEAIMGVLMQECNFDVELVIANDFSADKTDEVIKNIIKNHPKSSWIKYIKNKKNIGMMPNFISTLNQCNGKYIAICDGDDYWIDNKKLHKQVCFLDNNSDFSIIYTLHNTLYTNRELVKNEIKPINKRIATVKDIVLDNFIPASSTMFKNTIKGFKFSKWFYSSPYGDWPLYMMITQKGEKIKCLLEYTLVYRKNVGVMNEINLNKRILLEGNYKMFSNIFNDESYATLKPKVEYKLYIINIQLMKFLNRNKMYIEAFKKYRIISKVKLDTKKHLSMPIFKIYIKSLIDGFI